MLLPILVTKLKIRAKTPKNRQAQKIPAVNA